MAGVPVCTTTISVRRQLSICSAWVCSERWLGVAGLAAPWWAFGMQSWHCSVCVHWPVDVAFCKMVVFCPLVHCVVCFVSQWFGGVLYIVWIHTCISSYRYIWRCYTLVFVLSLFVVTLFLIWRQSCCVLRLATNSVCSLGWLASPCQVLRLQACPTIPRSAVAFDE